MTSDLNSIKTTSSTTTVIKPDATAIASTPFARDLWHNHFAFLRQHSIYANQITTDGETWEDDDTDLTGLFLGKEGAATNMVNPSQLGRRFVIYSSSAFHACQIAWFGWGEGWISGMSDYTILVETFYDYETWFTAAGPAAVTNNANPCYLKCDTAKWNNGSSTPIKYCRVTILKTTNLDTGNVVFTAFKAWTARKGNQGLGIENEVPYAWTKTDVYPYTTGQNLGILKTPWENVYSNHFVLSGGTSSQFLKADGSTDTTVYVPQTTFDNTVGDIESILATI